MDSVDAAAHSAPSHGGGAQPPPISNYKGVMLCDRPAPKATGGQKAQVTSGGAQLPFSCCTGPSRKFEPIGLNPSKEQRAEVEDTMAKVTHASQEQNNHSVKHRKWLKKLFNDKRKARYEAEEEAVKREEKKARFRAHAARLRATIRQVKAEGGPLTKEALESHTAKTKKNGKPVWAMTEDEALDAEEADVDDLMDFVNQLDYKQYMDDFEVRQALAAMRTRISAIGEDKGKENAAPEDVPVLDLERMKGDEWKKVFAAEWNKSGDDEDAERPDSARSNATRTTVRSTARTATSRQDDARSVASRMSAGSLASAASDASEFKSAERVLQSSHSMRRVHSNQSVRALLAKKEGAQPRKLAAIVEEGDDDVDVGPTHKAPRTMAYHAEDVSDDQVEAEGREAGQKATARKRKVRPSNLPYLHRNPAI